MPVIRSSQRYRKWTLLCGLGGVACSARAEGDPQTTAQTTAQTTDPRALSDAQEQTGEPSDSPTPPAADSGRCGSTRSGATERIAGSGQPSSVVAPALSTDGQRVRDLEGCTGIDGSVHTLVSPAGSSISCAALNPTSGRSSAVLLSEVVLSCWDGAGGRAASEYSSHLTLSWQLLAGTDIAEPYDFCIKDLRPILGA